MSDSTSKCIYEVMFKNISFYKFKTISDTQSLQRELKASLAGVKGTILIATEGINGMLCGSVDQIDGFVRLLRAHFPEIAVKESFSTFPTFDKLIVKCKKEIITIRNSKTNPLKSTGKYLSPQELDQWYATGKDFVVLDTRNSFEYESGHFKNAVDPKIKSFGEFPKYLEDHKSELQGKPVVTYCTGGIRCEKATSLMLEMGIEDVYQVEGGILTYFEKTSGENFEGRCFVFDKREHVDSKLNPA